MNIIEKLFRTLLNSIFLAYVFCCLVAGGEIILSELLMKYTGKTRNALEFAVVLALIVAPISLAGLQYFLEHYFGKKKK